MLFPESYGILIAESIAFNTNNSRNINNYLDLMEEHYMTTIQRVLALAAFSAVLAGCAATDTGAKKEEAKPAAAATAAAPDAALTKSVQAGLAKEDQLKGTKISVNATTDGAVTLGGETKNDWQKYLAGDIAKKTAGVKSVKNAIKVPE